MVIATLLSKTNNMNRILVIALFIVFQGISLLSIASKIPADSQPGTTPATKESTSSAPQPGIHEALKEFRSLDRSEKKYRVKAAKEAFKQYKADRKAGHETSTNTLLMVIIAILLPPLAVYLHEGVINNKFWLSLLLTLLFWLPGVIYALIVVLGK